MDVGNKQADIERKRAAGNKIESAKNFLHERNLLPHVYNLLCLVGANFVRDFQDIDEPLLRDIENMVRDEHFLSGDTTKTERIKYFGCDVKNLSSFSFTVLERRKLAQVAIDAKQHIEEPNEEPKLSKKTKRSNTSSDG